MKKQSVRTSVLILAGYLLLLLLLVYAESFDPESPITSLPLAVWYSLVTMTTVGYGDLYPVTAAGRIIGVLFLLLSAGALTALISFGVAWITGTGLPKMRLRRIGDRRVYIFDGRTSAAEALAKNIFREEQNALCIFSAEGGGADGNIMQVAMPVQEIVRSLATGASRPTVIFTGADAEERLSRCGVGDAADLVCETSHIPEEPDRRIRFFDRNDLCTAMYWQRYPLAAHERTIMLVGFSGVGRRMLEYALENCVFSPIRTVEYHVFGAGEEFLLDHPCLGDSVSIGVSSQVRDSLFLHSDPWNASLHLLMTADRIVFCSDDEEENLASYQRLKTYFPVMGKVHLYSTGCFSEAFPSFGTDAEIYTPEAVLRAGLERMAREINEIYRGGCDGKAPGWEELSPFLRRSNYASAQHLNEKLRFLLEDDSLTTFTKEQMQEAYRRFRVIQQTQPDLCRRIEHDRWVRFHAMYNWNYAPVRNNAMRQHPMMVPYNDLSESEQVKDDYAWELIGSLAGRV